MQPPSPLLAVCGLPVVVFGADAVNDTLVNGFIDWRSAARACAAQMNRLREWYKDAPKQDH